MSLRELSRFFRALCGPLRLSAARAAIDGIRVRSTLMRKGLRPLVRNFTGHPPGSPEKARRVAAAVDAGLGILPVGATCLRRSVTLLRELDRLKMSGTLHIGVRHGLHGIEAHAWVQSGSEVLNDDPAEIGTYAEISAGEAERILPELA
ncbi:lasso peptide biosynthesis B2 protein [Blastococcus sp. SYSU D01050]